MTAYLYKLRRSLSRTNSILKSVRNTPNPSKLEILKIQSYIVLTHASFENYLEDVSLNLAIAARKKYKIDGKITDTLVALISAGLIDELATKSRTKALEGIAKSIEVFSVEAFNKYRTVVANNHGIKTENQDKLTIPIGLKLDEFDAALSAALDSFGAKRGVIAHTHPSIVIVDTRNAISTAVSSILSMLTNFDQELQKKYNKCKC